MDGTEEAKSGAEAPRASKTLSIAGFIITGLWISGLLLYVGLNVDDFAGLEPNELGDFAAGAFAPLAFLWLVLGFFQQGEELRYSGKALWLQGEELRNSVEQQRELVKVTREQLLFESTALMHQQEELTRKARPILQLTSGSTTTIGGDGGGVKVDFNLTNHGRACTDVAVSIPGTSTIKRDVLPTGEKIAFRKKYEPGPREPFTVLVTFIDERLLTGQRQFTVTCEQGAGFVITSDEPA